VEEMRQPTRSWVRGEEKRQPARSVLSQMEWSGHGEKAMKEGQNCLSTQDPCQNWVAVCCK
jgi:hypothetical protein